MTSPTATEHLLELAVAALGGQPRSGQAEMAEAVTAAIDAGQHLLVQAGTGTGKSLGYLVPAAKHAVEQNQTVIVSTATLALQRQIVTRDLPLVAKAVAPELPRAPEFALLKGWGNYLCLQKIGGGYPAEEPGLFEAGQAEPARRSRKGGEGEREGLADQVRRLHEWARETDTGDRDDLVPGVTEKAWRQVSVSKLECLGARCPLKAECFPEQARGRAFEADVVVTNHAILGIAASGSPQVMPEHDVLVVDEAHELADRVTGAATVELSQFAVEHASRLGRRHAGVASPGLDTAGKALGSLLMDTEAGLFPTGLPPELREAVGAVRDAARELMSACKPTAEDKDLPDGGRKLAQTAALVLFETAERIAAQDTSADVIWCSRPGDGLASLGGEGASRLLAAPLQVAGLIHDRLLDDVTGVFTSATLALGGGFEAIARSLGLFAEDGSWRGLDVGSPFDYPSQGILYVADHLPAPGREPTTDAQLDTIEELIEAAGGRTLALFSSRRAAEQAAAAMRERLAYPVLVQGEDQLSTLVAAFLAEPEACLFGTLSLWQGVDVPGEACQLIIIDRIPFPRPDDPVRSARAREVERRGGSGFMQISAVHAALMLAQGAGRLIRTLTDRGVVAVLDPRLVTKQYGRFLTRSMPAFWPTTDLETAKGALRRLSET